jgi:hypothetical protein
LTLTPLLGLMLRRSSSGMIASEKQRHFSILVGRKYGSPLLDK